MYSLDKIVKHTLTNPKKVKDKSVILRVCLNLTRNKETGKYDDISRLNDALASIKHIYKHANKILVIAHLGRPEKYDKKLSLKPIVEILINKLKDDFEEVDYSFLEKFTDIANCKSKLIFLDNIRFFYGEDSDNVQTRKKFAAKLAEGFDMFINDAFADYRKSASTYEIAKILPSFIGTNYFSEIKNLLYLKKPRKPFIAIVGGFKMSEKIDLINKLIKTADLVIIGGAMSYTILKKLGYKIGDSFVEKSMLNKIDNIIKHVNKKVLLPMDHLVIKDFNQESLANSIYTNDEDIPEGHFAVDIGKETIAKYRFVIESAKTILFNGPLGVNEWKQSAKGTYAILDEIIENKSAKKFTGGGDTLATLKKKHIENFTYISKGGGAMLSFIANDKFDTLEAIL